MMMNAKCDVPRLLIAGLSGGSGKTIATMGLLLLLRRAGIDVRAFKKGPDYIDPAWLAWASGYPARNLDAFLMGEEGARRSFLRHSVQHGINLIEGNRGLFDGVDASGTYSSAALAEALEAPIVLVLDATKMTRTAAALVLGCQTIDPRAQIRAVVLNNVNGRRHERVLREAIESACAIPVIGAFPRLTENPLPERHLGLVPPDEHDGMHNVKRRLLEWMDGHVDLDALIAIAHGAPPIERDAEERTRLPDALGLRIAYVRDEAFSFYYPENLEALERAGAELICVSALDAAELPDRLDALYIGGGFPEMHAQALSKNMGFLESLRLTCENGLPVYAECGGLMLLARSLTWKGSCYPMSNVLPIDVAAMAKPQGHGYCELSVDAENPFFPRGTRLRGHEFHYSRITSEPGTISSACAVDRGAGCFAGRDGLVIHNVMATYTHLHAEATPEWALGMIIAARAFSHIRTRTRTVCESEAVAT
jgi:cobyrinic acid a,c-diamide synthase